MIAYSRRLAAKKVLSGISSGAALSAAIDARTPENKGKLIMNSFVTLLKYAIVFKQPD